MTPKRNRLGAGALLFLIVLGSYWPVTRAGFIWDDDDYVSENDTLRDLAGLKRIWFEAGATPQYYPLVHTTFWIEYRLWELEPGGFHLVNVALHALNVLLLWTVLRRLSVPGAWLAAALFAAHPVHVESVAWITERKNVLSGAFYLLSLLTYLRFAKLDSPHPTGRRRWGLYHLALILFCAALLSKTVTASLPAAILLLLWWKRGRPNRRDLLPLAPFFALGAGFGLVTAWLERTHVGATGDLWALTPVERLLVAGRAVWFYAAKLAWPARLSFNYERWNVDSSVWWQYLYPLAAVLLIVLLWQQRARIGRGPLVAALFFAGTLVPALGFFNVYPFRYAYVADHFQYLASLGPYAAVAALAVTLCSNVTSVWRKAGTLLAGIVLAILAALTWTQTRIYGGLEVLWRDTLLKSPTSWLANNNLGNIHMRRGEVDQAITHFHVALQSSPTYVETHMNMSIAMTHLGRHAEAIRYATRAVELRPQNKFPHNRLGTAHLAAGHPREAILHLRRALERDPEFLEARTNLAVAMTQTGNPGGAIIQFETILERDPERLTARTNLGIALAQTGRFDAAIEHFEQALRLDPDNPVLLENLALARAKASGD
ncbi:MAG: tetratricopeptide repeat protein [bacterium]|nr:tetratricopeptide repeat protein [bacterium]